jgi:ubiquinone biosynthesis monooxygenase Coq7
MNKNQIIENYGAKNITISDDMIGWVRSNHAGETVAVWIYLGASCAFWSKKIREMAAEHRQTELNHLIVMEHIVAKHRRSNLIFLWKIMAFGLGFLPSIFGYRASCITIKAVL